MRTHSRRVSDAPKRHLFLLISARITAIIVWESGAGHPFLPLSRLLCVRRRWNSRGSIALLIQSAIMLLSKCRRRRQGDRCLDSGLWCLCPCKLSQANFFLPCTLSVTDVSLLFASKRRRSLLLCGMSAPLLSVRLRVVWPPVMADHQGPPPAAAI